MGELKLKDICSLITCGVAKRPDYFETGIPFLSSRNVKANRIILDEYKFISKEAHEQLTKNNKPEKGDILYTRVGSFGEAAINNLDFEFSVFVSLTLIKPKHEIVNNKYLMYFLNSPVTQALAKKSTTGSGVQNLNVNTVREFKISLPKLSDQIRIAEILSQAESLIAQRKQSISLLDELLKSTFLEMFGDPVRNEKGWEISNIGKQCDVKGGKRIPKESKLVEENTGYPYIKAGNIKKGKITTTDLEYLTPEVREQLKRYIVERCDVCITVVGANIGDIGIVPEELHLANLTENANKLLIKDKRKINNIYLGYYLMMDFVQNNFNANIRAAGVPKLAIFRIEQVELLMPPIELQTKFANVVEKVEALKSQYQQSLTELQNMYGALSQKAFKGELSLDKKKIKEKV